MTVISDFRYSTCRAIEFAELVRDAGGDLYLPYPPDWGNSMTPETLAEHYASIGKIMPLLLIFSPLSGGAGPGMKSLELTFTKTDRVLAIKDDICQEAGRKLSIHYHPRCAVISGGQKQNHLNAHPYGLDGYFSTFSKLIPAIAHEYFRRIENNQILAAAQIIKDYDMPFFDHIITLPGGFDAGIHGMLEICGICPRHRRAPYYNLSDQELEELHDFVTKIKIIS